MPGQFDPAKLQKFLKAKAGGSEGARVGGKGTTRRKHKAVRKVCLTLRFSIGRTSLRHQWWCW
jgi:hypothetical protein